MLRARSVILQLCAVSLLILLVLPSFVSAQQPDLPGIAVAGFEMFEKAGADSAIAVWLRGTSMDTPATRASLAQGFARMPEQTARMVG